MKPYRSVMFFSALALAVVLVPETWIDLVGYTTNDAAPAPAIADALHALRVKRADDLEGGTGRSDEEREAYEAARWPHGKISGGRGKGSP